MTMRRTEMVASKRATTLPGSPIRRLAPLADAAKQRGIHVHHLNIGQPDLAPPPAMLASLERAIKQPLAYTPSHGIPAARDAWVNYYRHFGIELERDDVLVTSGASEALSLAFKALCNPGDEVLVPEPFFAPYTGLAAIDEVSLVPVPFGPNFSAPTVEAVRERLTDRTRALLICSPNNPTGTVYSRDELAALGALAVDAGIFIISDETYREMVFDGPRATSALEIPGLDDQVVVVDSVSKRFNACGVRIGTFVSRNRGVMKAAFDLAELRLSVPIIEQLAVVEALSEPQPYVDEVVAIYRERVDTVADALSRIPGVTYRKPDGAFYVAARLPIDDAEDFAAWLLADFQLDGETVMLTPMSDFYLTPDLGQDEVRLACVFDAATLARAVDVMAAGLAAYQARSEERPTWDGSSDSGTRLPSLR